MLKVENLSKSFGDLKVVDHLNFTVQPGEIMGLIGQNGSGKTTTFRMILDLLQPDQGKVTWNDQPIDKRMEDHIGFLPEERGLDQKQTVEQQILYFAGLRGRKPAEIKPQIDDWLDRFQVKGDKTDLVKKLSKGNQQKVQVIITLIHQPRLIILDEPFSGLDPVNAELLEEGIRQAKADGATIIFSSHNMNNVEELCDSLLMIKNGEQVLSGEVREVRNRFARTEIFLESDLSLEELRAIEGIQDIQIMANQVYKIRVEDESVGRQIFQLAGQDGFIPTFSQQPPSLESIFKRIAGEGDE